MRKIKKILASIPGVRKSYNTLVILSYFFYDAKRFLANSAYKRNKTKSSLLATIIITYHIIEKGLTMPGMYLGFGRKKLLELIYLCNEFVKNYGKEEQQLNVAVSVIAEYKKVHEDFSFKLDEKLLSEINALLDLFEIEPSCQIEMTRERYYSDLNASFEVFSASRHSVRNFSGAISKEQIIKAVELANNAPSACNRQFIRVHCISDRELIKSCLSFQNGNRGFGHLADKLLIITADISSVTQQERNDAYTNAGIYVMNLSYALHKNKVAHCMLNWSVSPSTDLKLRNFLNSTNIKISSAESIALFIACGDVPECFKLTVSKRKSVNETLAIY